MIGKWHGAPYHDYANKKWLLTFETDTPPEIYDRTKEEQLKIEVKKYRRGRSLNANSYFHVLVDKLADVQRLSHTEVHNQMIAEYGMVDEDIKNLILDDDIPWQRLQSIHLRPTTATKVLDNGKLYRVYIVMRGSHTYDTREMSRLIDGTVQEAKQQGIETLSPDEIERMVSLWKV